MIKYRFEIQNCIQIDIDAEKKKSLQDELAGLSCYISDGEEIDEK